MGNKIFIFLFLFSGLIFAQGKGISVTELKPKFAEYKFPYVESKANPKVAEKINLVLQVNELEHLPGKFKKHPFEEVAYDSTDCCWSIYFQQWQRFATPENILSLSISGDATGAYTEWFDFYRSFDTRTGNLILPEDIFTADGIQKITAIINDTLSLKIKSQIDEIKADADYYGPDSKEDWETAIRQYEECLDYVAKSDIYWNEYYFSNDSIVFVRGRCFNHATRALDNLDRKFIAFSYKQIDKFLSPYGKSLAYNNAENTKSQTPAAKIYKGFIGKYPITLMIPEIDNKDGSFTAKYWYDKKKIPIEWSGSFKNGHFSFREYDEQKGTSALIEADWSPDGKIIGTWKSAEKTLNLELSGY